ncbi:MAG: cytochrome P460 family protein [Rhodospirillaceae bacterium]|nr:cytochrome P460 family protein [Rhodospirillaceae bacterium]
MPLARTLLALALAVLPLAAAKADPKRIAFPEGYEKTWLPYAVHNRPDNGQVRHLFANPVAVEAAKDGKPVPSGAILMMEVYKAKTDAANQPVAGPDGLWEKGDVVFYGLMQTGAGWGEEHPEAIRNGDWNYATFSPGKTHNPQMVEKPCLECHKALPEAQYVFSWDELVAKVKGVPRIDAEPVRVGLAGDSDRGKTLFQRCTNCHTTDQQARAKVGPGLFGVAGRQVASAQNYAYSASLKALSAQPWSDERLERWLAGPRVVATDTKMVFPGFTKAQDRADVIAYLKTLK